jgi:hypothetical protein
VDEAQIEEEKSFHNRAEADAILLVLDQLAAAGALLTNSPHRTMRRR